MMKNLLILLTILFHFSACSQSVDVKYREDDVEILNFEELDTSKSSWIEGAWYDHEEDYMIIDLDGTKYHYCDMPESTWQEFKHAESFGKDYHKYIKGNYDCRKTEIPSY